MNWNDVIYLDLFSGVGGFAYGFYQGGMRFKHHYFSEIDKHSIAVYKYHYEEAQPVGDITDFSGDGIERPNLITFGFPCQDLSIAGKQAGLAGSRSGLFFQALRLIQRFRPEVFIFENVAGLLSSNEGQDFEIVLRAIADIGLYECEWQLVNTRWLLPQNRERIYLVGHLAGSSRPRVFPFREGDKEFNGNGQPSGDGVVSNAVDSNYWKVADGKRTMIQVIQKTQGNCTIGLRWQNKKNGVVIDNTAPTLRSSGGTDIRKMPNVVQLNPSLESGGQQPEVKRHPLKFLNRNQKNYEDDYAYTVDSVNTGGVKINGNIRRLTEIECERLQGFPDNWTEYGNYDGVIKKVPKTQRYKQMGNAVTTLWPKLIAKRLMKPC